MSDLYRTLLTSRVNCRDYLFRVKESGDAHNKSAVPNQFCCQMKTHFESKTHIVPTANVNDSKTFFLEDRETFQRRGIGKASMTKSIRILHIPMIKVTVP